MAGSSSSGGSPRTPHGDNSIAKRSRKGCWTCRVRKVKCDEMRPVCRQCTRLQLKCEGYSMRLSFRDDTRRVMKRMSSSISLHGNPIFDALSRKHYPQILQIGNEEGDLPIVEMLLPSAFEEGGEYWQVDINGNPGAPSMNHTRSNSLADEATETEIILESLLQLGASNAMELERVKHQEIYYLDANPMGPQGTFSDSRSLTRSDGSFTPDRSLSRSNQFSNNMMASPFMTGSTLDFDPGRDIYDEPMFQSSNGEYYSGAPSTSTSIVHRSLPSLAPPGITTSNERKFLHHYLHVISARITTPDRGRNNPFRNAFARLATDFPPLLHGILAISAADLSRYDRHSSQYEAFLHYQGCVSLLAAALNDPSALVADEALATISLLFLHEMSNMDGLEWKRHMLGAIEILRHKVLSGIPRGRDTPFISTYMSVWETLASITTGETPLTDFLVTNNLMVPPGKGLLYPDIQKTDDERAEYTLVGPMNAFQRPLLLIVARISKLAHRSRILPPPGYPITADMISVEAFDWAVNELDCELDELWERKRPALIDDLITYDSADEVFRTRWRRGIPTAQRVTSLHRAAIIFLFRTRTDRKLIESPFLLNHRRPGEIWDDGIDEQPPRIAQAVEDILTVTRDIVKTKTERERRFMLWPLVCAGLECREVHDQEFILHVLDEMSYVTWGTNFQKTKALLQEIFKRQGGVRMSPHGHGKMEGRWRRVDWLGVMQEMGPIVFV